MNIDKQEPRRIEALIKFGEWNYQFGGSVVFAYSAFIYPSGNNTLRWGWEGERELPFIIFNPRSPRGQPTPKSSPP